MQSNERSGWMNEKKPQLNPHTQEIGPFDEFYKAVEAKKEHGWKSKKVNGQWEDWCDKCCREGGMKK
jgi:hypothetical protein